MTVASIARQGTDFFVPAFAIKVGGRPVDREAVRDVLSVSFKDSLETIDRFDLVVNNWDEERRTFKYSDGDVFAPGKKVELKMGYRDAQLVPILTGEITSLTPSFPSGGMPTLAVSGLSILHRLRKEQRSEVYEKMTETDIGAKIAGKLGVDIETVSGENDQPLPYVVQHSEHDIVFLLKRARRVGYELTVREDELTGKPKLFYGPAKRSNEAAFKLTWGGSLLSFNPKLTTANQVGSVTVRTWHRTSKKKIEAKATRADFGGDEPFQDAFNERQEVIADRPVANEGEAKQLAIEALRRIQQNYVTASGATMGLPQLRTGVLVEIEGLGKRFSGKYFITSSSHAIGDGGYRTSFQARLEPT